MFSLILSGYPEPIPVEQVDLERTLGEAVRWRFWITADDDPLGASVRMRKLAAVFAAGPVEVMGTAGIGRETFELGIPGIVTRAARTQGRRQDVRLEADAARAPAHVFAPRSRVITAPTMASVIAALEDVAVPTLSVQNVLAYAKLKDGGQVIQHGASDFTVLRRALGQQRLLAEDPARGELLLTGSTSPATEGRWIITWATAEGYDRAGERSARTVDLGALEGVPFHDLATLEDRARSGHSACGAAVSTVRGLDQRPFSKDAWLEWTRRDPPLFADGGWVWRITDRLTVTSDEPRRWEDRVGWETVLDLLPEPVSLAPAAEDSPVWHGFGTMEAAGAREHRAGVALLGFERGASRVLATLSTQDAGPTGESGLHLLPAEETRVALSWSGRFDEPVLLLGCAREHDVSAEAPSLHLARPLRIALDRVAVDKLGEITAEPDLDVHIRGRVTAEAEGPARLTADGAAIVLQGGVVHHGSS